ncbi:NADH:flavin oxidoreductase [Hyphomicrobium sp.]|uniref:NADH:flavin oxidoreductase n=1 Tax=Hyphomicrobium sp. TaxID=82 RepID=UPI003F710ECC
MTRVSATDDGAATQIMKRYYERFAKGGFGLLITEGLYSDKAYSQGYLHQPGLSDDAQASSWKPIVERVQSHGARIFAQIMHAGAISQGNRFRANAVGPSAIKPKGEQMTFYYGQDDYATPAQITDSQIADAIDGFGDAVARAKAVGFDGIEIHGANGYLLDQFLTDYTNTRTDRWGGGPRERMAIILAVVEAVRAKVGQSVPVGVRISQGKVNDFGHKWPEGERAAEAVFGSLADAGVDYVHITEFEAWKPAFGTHGPSLVALARRYAWKTRIIANGNLQDLEKAQEVLQHGADIIALGKGALANPNLPLRASQNESVSEFDPSILGPIADIKEVELSY